jgi:hypothetical protein
MELYPYCATISIESGTTPTFDGSLKKSAACAMNSMTLASLFAYMARSYNFYEAIATAARSAADRNKIHHHISDSQR